MRLTTLKAIGALAIALAVVFASTKLLGVLAVEVGGSVSSQLYKLADIETKSPPKAESTGKPRYYRYVDGPNGPTLVHK